MARVLIVCERLARGGLETQIAGYVRIAAELGHELHLAASADSNIEPLRSHLAGWHEVDLLGDTGEGILDAAARLDAIAERLDFDWVHLHPFMSFWAGGLFAARRRLPYLVHVHGPISLSPLYGVGYRAYLAASLLPSARQVLAVSAESVRDVRQLSPDAPVKCVPNGVDVERIAEARRAPGGAWALVSRLDHDKLEGLQQALRMFAVARHAGRVAKVRVVGDGDARSALERFARELPDANEWLHFAGPNDDVTALLAEGTCAVAGMGRVVLEAAALDLPVALVGYDGLKGWVTRSNVRPWAEKNFSGRGVRNLSEEQWLDQLALLAGESLPNSLRLRAWAARNADGRRIWSACLAKWSAMRRRPMVPEWVGRLEELCATLGGESIRSVEGQRRLLDAAVRARGYDFGRDLFARTEWEMLREQNAQLRLRESVLTRQLAQKTDELQAQIDRQSADLRAAQARLDEFDAREAELQQTKEQAERLRQELEEAARQRDSLHAAVGQLTEAHRGRLQALQDELEHARRQLVELEEHRRTLQNSILALTEAQQTAEARLRRAAERHRRLRGRLRTAAALQKQQGVQLAEAALQRDRLVDELAVRERAQRQLLQQIDQLQAVLRVRAAGQTELQARVADLHAQLDGRDEALRERLAECQWREGEQGRLQGIIGGLSDQKQRALDRQAEMIEQLEWVRTWRSYRLMRAVRRIKHLLFAGPRGWWALLAGWGSRLIGRTRPGQDFDPLAPILAEGRQRIRELQEEPTPRPSAAHAPPPTGEQPQEPIDWLDLLPAEQLPLVSVMLPVYNHADLVAESIDSVLSQSYPRFELIILDDGSTDQIDQVLARYAGDARVRIYRQPNQTLPRALTHLHALARGELLCWTSADNRMRPAMLDRLVRRLLSEPEAVMVFADVQVIDETGRPVQDGDYRRHNRDRNEASVLRLPRRSDLLALECDNYVNGCFVYRRWAAEAVGMRYADDLGGLEDYDFWLRLQKAGPIVHLANDEPLYEYRVHSRTMSEDLLTARRERHLRRGQQLIEYEAARRRWCERRWRVALAPALPTETADAVRRVCESLPVDLVGGDHDGEPGEKVIRVVSELPSPSKDGFYLVMRRDELRIVLIAEGKAVGDAAVCAGVEVPLLAIKARHCQQTRWEYPQAGERPILGTHWPLGAEPIDLDAAREVMRSHPSLFFVWIDVAGADDADAGARLVADLPNAVYLGPRDLGVDYWSYATWQAWWIPPRPAGSIDRAAVRQTRALALATGRWCLEALPHEHRSVDRPCVLPLPDDADYAAVLDRVMQAPPDHAVADRLLDALRPERVWQRAFRLADAMGQERFVLRPDFEPNRRPVVEPQPWRPGERFEISPKGLRVALLADTLDRGGLEQVVALLARGLRALGCEVMMTCGQSGGLAADRLANDGFPVQVAEGRADRLRDIWQRWRPDVISSHYVHAGFDVARALSVPLVETVHNMYGHYADDDWRAEREKARCVARFVAVSELVRKHFLRHCPGVSPDRVEVITNPCAAPAVRDGVDLRGELGIDPDAFVLLNVASLDGRKNQLGLLTAFEEVHKDRRDAVLVIVGNRAHPLYAEKVDQHLATLPCRGAVRLRDFTEHIGDYYAAADVVVLPSYMEGWSIAATEALMMGRPLVHTECGSAWELCGRFGERGVVVPNPAGDPLRLTQRVLYAAMNNPSPPNTGRLVRAMRQMVDRRATWAARRGPIARFARESFTVEKASRRYADLLCRVAAGSHAPAGLPCG